MPTMLMSDRMSIAVYIVSACGCCLAQYACSVSQPLQLCILALAVLFCILAAIVRRWDGDDDDEAYYALFNAEASPVATPRAFAKILESIPIGSELLDIGVGSGTYLEHEPVRRLLRERELRCLGVDISAPNVLICQQRIKKHGLEAHFSAKVIDARTIDHGEYDVVLFMESFPCMSIGLFCEILTHAHHKLRKPGGRTLLYHNLTDPAKLGSVGISVGRVLKPRLKYLVGVDFGRLTTASEMADIVRRALPTERFSIAPLLRCPSAAGSVSFAKVSDPWHRLCGSNLAHLVSSVGEAGMDMEQHLVSIESTN